MKKNLLKILTLVLSIAIFAQGPSVISADQTKDDTPTGKVHLSYVDTSGYVIHSPDVIEGDIGTPYVADNLQWEKIMESEYPFWIPWGVEGAKTGVFTEEDQYVTFYFNKFGENSDMAFLSVIHKDISGREIWIREEHRNIPGKPYKTKPAAIPGYSLVSDSGNTEGDYGSGNSRINVAYTYKMDPVEEGKGVVFVIYRSPKEGEVSSELIPQAKSVLLVGDIDADYTAPYKDEIQSGDINTIPSNLSGKFSNDPIFVTFDYKGKNHKVNGKIVYHLLKSKIDDSIDLSDLSTVDNHPSLIHKENSQAELGGADWDLPYDTESLAKIGNAEQKDKFKFVGFLEGSEQPSGLREYTGRSVSSYLDTPVVYLYDQVKFDITYTDGVDNEVIFADQKYTNVDINTLTPAFNGTPEREGYTFIGWSPELKERVTEDVTYVAQWEEVKTEFTVTYIDGVNGTVFEDESTVVKEGEVTPEYSKEITRYGYVFDGWLPEVAPTVTENVTYIAQWKAIDIFTITYTDGVEGEEVFKDQVTNVYRNDPSPIYEGTKPTRIGYTFKGWSPDYIGVVTENIIYTAQWEKVDVPVSPVDPNNPTLPSTGVPNNHFVVLTIVLGGLVIGLGAILDKKKDLTSK